MCQNTTQGMCPHQNNPIDNRARRDATRTAADIAAMAASVARLAAAEEIVNRYPGIARNNPDLAGNLAAYDARVATDGPESVQSPTQPRPWMSGPPARLSDDPTEYEVLLAGIPYATR